MQVQPYLFFEGRAEEAIEFYKKAVGAKVTMLMRNKEAPEKPPPGMLPPGSDDKVMHASMTIGDSVVMVSDGSVSGKPNFAGVSLSLGVENAAEGERKFKALGEGGKVTMPYGKTFFAEGFGMLTDKFGVGWMVVAGAMQG
jgi:PhnB protein